MNSNVNHCVVCKQPHSKSAFQSSYQIWLAPAPLSETQDFIGLTFGRAELIVSSTSRK